MAEFEKNIDVVLVLKKVLEGYDARMFELLVKTQLLLNLRLFSKVCQL